MADYSYVGAISNPRSAIAACHVLMARSHVSIRLPWWLAAIQNIGVDHQVGEPRTNLAQLRADDDRRAPCSQERLGRSTSRTEAGVARLARSEWAVLHEDRIIAPMRGAATYARGASRPLSGLGHDLCHLLAVRYATDVGVQRSSAWANAATPLDQSRM